MAPNPRSQAEITVLMRDQFSQVAARLDQAFGRMQTAMRRVQSVARVFGAAFSTVGGAVTRLASSLFNLRSVIAGVAAAFVAGRLVQSLRQTAKDLADVNDQARRLGASSRELFRLQLAGKLAGLETQSLVRGLGILGRQIGALRRGQGSEQLTGALSALGISRDQVANVRQITDLLPLIADGLERIPGDAERLSILQALFGRGAFEVAGFFEGGSGRLREALEAVDRFVPSVEQFRAAADLDDAVDRLGFAFSRLRASVIEGVGPEVTQFLDRFSDSVVALSDRAGPILTSIVAVLTDPALIENSGFLGNLLRPDNLLIDVGGEDVNIGGAVRALRDAIVNAGADAITELIVLAARLLVLAVPTIFNALRTAISPLLASLFDSIGRSLQNSALANGLGIPGLFADLARELRAGGGAFGDFEDALRENLGGISNVIGESFTKIGASFGSAFESVRPALDDLERAGRAIRGVREETEKLGEAAPAVKQVASEWEKFALGVDVGFRTVVSSFNDIGKAATELGTTIGSALTDGLSGALADAATGFSTLGEALRNFVADALRQLTQLLFRLLLVRALTSVFPGLGAAPTGAQLGVLGVGARTGGLVGALKQRVLGFASGGSVPGGGADRDTVPALLSPAEFVLRRSAVQSVGVPFLDALNTGRLSLASLRGVQGRAEGGSMGGSSDRSGAPVPAYVLANDQQVSTLLSGGKSGFLRFLRDNGPAVRSAIGGGP